jgi:23S rRNA pseudouridine2605 synthase
MPEVRLQRFLAECGIGSRRKMERFIIEGRVRVNGKVVMELGTKVNPEVDKVEVNRRPVHAAPKGIMLLHKPKRVMSTLSDPEGRPTVADYLTKHYQSYFPVGRLDWDSSGLMVLTNDGDLAERLMHPRHGFERVYQVRVEGPVSEELLAKIRRGVKLSDGMVQASGALMRGDDKSTWIEVRIHEGRNRVVRRLFEKLGHPVMKLKRVVYGPFKLGRLQPGQIRVLTLDEYLKARRKVMTHEIQTGKDAEREERSERPQKPHGDRRRGEQGDDRRGERSSGRGSDRRERRGGREDRRDASREERFDRPQRPHSGDRRRSEQRDDRKGERSDRRERRGGVEERRRGGREERFSNKRGERPFQSGERSQSPRGRRPAVKEGGRGRPENRRRRR